MPHAMPMPSMQWLALAVDAMPCPCIVQSAGPLFGLMSVDSTTNVNPGSLTFPRITMISTTNVGRIHDTS